MIGVSGIRGVVGAALSPGKALAFVQAYATWLKRHTERPKVLLARDTRPTGEMMRHAVLSGLLASGCEVIDLDIVATPTLQLSIPRLEADGAICITASHNPVEWNALKFFQPNGMYIDKAMGADVLEIYHARSFSCNGWDKMGSVTTNNDAVDFHLQKVLSLVDVEKIRQRKFKVVLDCCCGAGTTISPQLLEALGCEVIPLHCDLTGVFPHNPEPLNKNLTELCKAVPAHGADVGFAHDADADRVALVTNDGFPIGEDYALVWAVAHTLKNRKRGPVVTNLSTSMAVDAVAKQYDCAVSRTPVGDINVSSKMKEIGAVIGGEGNGGVIIPDIQYGRDGMATLAYLLEFIAESGTSASELSSTIPRFANIKSTIDFPREKTTELLTWLKVKEKNARVDERDGVKFEWPKNGETQSWAHIRPSGTEPFVRVICEAQTEEEAERIQSSFRQEMEAFAEGW
jgi:phosphomannomutase